MKHLLDELWMSCLDLTIWHWAVTSKYTMISNMELRFSVHNINIVREQLLVGCCCLTQLCTLSVFTLYHIQHRVLIICPHSPVKHELLDLCTNIYYIQHWLLIISPSPLVLFLGWIFTSWQVWQRTCDICKGNWMVEIWSSCCNATH
jgi:hypothetical protein